MSNNHKFVSNNSPNTYGVVVFCEYCGLIAFSGNDSDEKEKERKKELLETNCKLNTNEQH